MVERLRGKEAKLVEISVEINEIDWSQHLSIEMWPVVNFLVANASLAVPPSSRVRTPPST